MNYLMNVIVLFVAYGSAAFRLTVLESEGPVAERELKGRKHKLTKAREAAFATKAPEVASLTKPPKAASATEAPKAASVIKPPKSASVTKPPKRLLQPRPLS